MQKRTRYSDTTLFPEYIDRKDYCLDAACYEQTQLRHISKGIDTFLKTSQYTGTVYIRSNSPAFQKQLDQLIPFLPAQNGITIKSSSELYDAEWIQSDFIHELKNEYKPYTFPVLNFDNSVEDSPYTLSYVVVRPGTETEHTSSLFENNQSEKLSEENETLLSYIEEPARSFLRKEATQNHGNIFSLKEKNHLIDKTLQRLITTEKIQYTAALHNNFKKLFPIYPDYEDICTLGDGCFAYLFFFFIRLLSGNRTDDYLIKTFDNGEAYQKEIQQALLNKALAIKGHAFGNPLIQEETNTADREAKKKTTIAAS